VAERLKAPVLKTGKGQPFVSSNLTASAIAALRAFLQSGRRSAVIAGAPHRTGNQLPNALSTYLVAAAAIVAGLLLRPLLVPQLGESWSFVILCAAIALVVWWAARGPLVHRAKRDFVTSPEGRAQVAQHGGERLASARLLAAIVETSDDAIVSKSLDGIIRSWNAAAQRVFGHSAERAIGSHISLIIPPERLGEEDEIMRRLRAGERIDHFETMRLRSDGRRIPISLTISPIKDDSGRVVGASKIARDISARKHSEALLNEKDARLRLAMQTGRVGIWEWDSATGRFSCTESLNAIYGITQDAFGGTFNGFIQTVHADDRDRVARSLQRSLNERLGCELEFRAYKPDGQQIWIYTSAATVEHELQSRHLIGASLDITDRHQAEEDLRVADRRKDEFLATLAHELRNPLAPIWTAAQVLKLKGAADPDLRWSGEVIDRQMRHMVRLLEDLLDVSRISQNKLDLRKEPVVLGTMLETAVETSRPMIDSAQHELSMVLPEQRVRLFGDPVRLAQVFSNLLNNAAKYMQPHGRIEIRAECNTASVSVSVRDQGFGIAVEALPHVFEIFAQGNSREARVQGGLGIGLWLARAIVQLHGGTIDARSDGPGKGSEFVVTLPVAVEDSVAPVGEPRARDERADSTRRLLIVDDLRDSADSLAALMRIKGHEVHTAYEGETAVALAGQLHPDVMLLDIGLPKLSGYDVCRLVREQPGGDAIFIVAVTGWGQPGDRRRTEEAGFDWHLVKPVDGATLADLLVSLPRVARGMRTTALPQ
jgi:PAS domain S-box-containing protein